MLTRMKLGNFKSWKELDIELAPITVLFGTNSSGKSSVLQALLMLVQSMKGALGNSINFGGNATDLVNLGSYRDTVYKHDLKRGVLIELTWESKYHKGVETQLRLRYRNDDVEIDETGDFMGILSDYVISDDAIHYLGPLRQHPQRSYLWSGASPSIIEPNGNNTIPALISSQRHEDDLLSQVAEWLINLSVVEEFEVKPLDRDKRFYEPRITIGDISNSLLDVGFGVSQVLPVITMLFFVPKGSIVLLEQPELHLHPSAQAKLADLFLHVAETRKLQLIVESHSEHLLRRLQRRIAEPEYPFASPENIKTYFFHMGENGSEKEEVKIDEYGQILNWPSGFFGDITGDLEAMAKAAMQRVMNGSGSGG
jgi:predicted ATPase